mmetsp:Transcript_88445/g.239747  ORF Transcript_88445/g.239747 Transcript_88445/m.239747 type:complete len:208 (+) Transcript_88445:685-1308(+)
MERRGRPGAGSGSQGGGQEVAGGPRRVRPAHRGQDLHEWLGPRDGEADLPPDEPRAIGQRDGAGLRRDERTPEPRRGGGPRRLPAPVRPPGEAEHERLRDRPRGRRGTCGCVALADRPATPGPGQQCPGRGGRPGHCGRAALAARLEGADFAGQRHRRGGEGHWRSAALDARPDGAVSGRQQHRRRGEGGAAGRVRGAPRASEYLSR